MHEEKLKLLDVVHEELQEAVGEDVPGALVGSVSDVGHGKATLESPAHTSIDTLGLPPARVLDPHKPVRLMPRKLLVALLDHIDLVDGMNSTHGYAVQGLLWSDLAAWWSELYSMAQ